MCSEFKAQILLDKQGRVDMERGQVLAKPGSIGSHRRLAATLHMRTKEEGGRETPFSDGYRPFFYDPFWGPYPYYGYGAYPIGVTQNIYVAPDDTFKLQIAMDRLQPGEASDPAPIPARRLSPSTDQ